MAAELEGRSHPDPRHNRQQRTWACASAAGLFVLVIGDEAVRDLASWLRLDGHRVQLVAGGLAVLRVSWAEAPDVVLLDANAAGEASWDTVAQLREQATLKKPFCIALNASGSEEERRRSANAGVDLYCGGPVHPDQLRRILRRFQAILNPDHPG